VTVPDLVAADPRRARLLRRLFLGAMALFLAAGLLGVLGVRTVEAHASGGGYELHVRYARVARPGLAAPWSLRIVKTGGFSDGETVRVRLDPAYFDLFDENGFDPDPVASTSDGEFLVQEFETPAEGSVLELSFDARIEPGAQSGGSGRAAVLDDGGEVLAEVRYHTTVLP
jgi:hypothetical protein